MILARHISIARPRVPFALPSRPSSSIRSCPPALAASRANHICANSPIFSDLLILEHL